MRLVGKAKEQVEREELDRLAQQARQERNRLLAESDWTVLPDSPVANKAEWITYRQALRDLPSQKSFPKRVVFPDKPKELKETRT